MKNFITRWLTSTSIFCMIPCVGLAQNWEVGGAAGYSFYHNVSVTGPSVSGSTGFESGYSAGALLGNNTFRYFGGELRYTYSSNDLRVTSGGTKVTFAGQSHALHYDVLAHLTPKESAVRPFLAFGGGVKFYRGTGTEQAFQPLSNLVVLSHTNQLKPLVSAGGGVKFRVSQHALVRLDIRDYMTPYPKNLLAVPSGSIKTGGWFHDFVVMLGISTTFSHVSSEGMDM